MAGMAGMRWMGYPVASQDHGAVGVVVVVVVVMDNTHEMASTMAKPIIMEQAAWSSR